MRFPALLLSLVILISLFFSGVRPGINNEEKPENSFFRDVFFGLREKTIFLQNNIAESSLVFKNKTAADFKILSENLAEADKVTSYNFANMISSGKNETNEAVEVGGGDVFAPSSSFAGNFGIEKVEFDGQRCDLISNSFNGKAALLKYLNYNIAAFELNSQKRWPIASLTKLMTGVVAAEKIGFDKKITISEKAAKTEGAAGDFKTGEIFSSGDLIKAMMTVSSNDAAVALAEFFGENEFVNEMQKKASELMMRQTTFVEPTGLSFINQSTASDLEKLIIYIYYNHPEILAISKEREIEMKELKTAQRRKLININKFSGRNDFVGGKTGYTEEAGRNLIAFFEINEQMILSVVLGAVDSFEETNKLLKCL
ncbi:MAG: serine hydrolase [Patescibacteria group bacterium]